MKKKIISAVMVLSVLTAAAPVMAANSRSGELNNGITWTIDENGLLTLEGEGAVEFGAGEENPFRDNTDIVSVVMDEHITALGDQIFAGCTSLESVDLSENLQKIGDSAFSGCSSLKGIELDESLTGLGAGAFSGCTALRAIDTDENNGSFSSVEGVLFDDDKSELIKFPAARAASAYAIPETVIEVHSGAFSDCDQIEVLDILGAVASLGDQDFYYSSALREINVADDNAVYSSDTGILFDKSGRTLICFPPASEHDKYTVPDSVRSIGSYAFCLAANLERVYIPATVTKIETDAFSDCKKLSDIYFSGTQEQWNAIYPRDRFYSVNSGVDDITIHIGADGIETESTSKEFPDTEKDAWYYGYVRYAIDNGLIDGISDTEFAPDADITRGVFVTALYRLESSPEVAAANRFTDVDDDAFYADAVIWGSENGIINGVSDTEFEPEERITREQLAAIIYRYVKYKGEEGLTGDALLQLDYTDSESISEYAYEPMLWCSKNEIIGGFDDGTVRPQGNTTRAQAAAIIMRINDR